MGDNNHADELLCLGALRLLYCFLQFSLGLHPTGVAALPDCISGSDNRRENKPVAQTEETPSGLAQTKSIQSWSGEKSGELLPVSMLWSL